MGDRVIASPHMRPSRTSLVCFFSLAAAALVLPVGCGGGEGDGAGPGSGASGAAGTSGASGSSGSSGGLPELRPGEHCDNTEAFTVKLRTSSTHLFLAPGQTRTLSIVVEPDICSREDLTLELGGAVASFSSVGGAFPGAASGQKATAKVDVRDARVEVAIKGEKPGATKLTASFTLKGATTTLDVPVDVLDPALGTCSGQVSGNVKPGGKVGGDTAVLGASVGLQERADDPARAKDQDTGFLYESPVLWPQGAFDATVACAADIVPDGLVALGPAITFGPDDKAFRREIPLAIPINPAAIPDMARLRHVRVAYSGPAFKAPRTIPVADPWIDAGPDGTWVLRFMAPRLGTYQAVIPPDAGKKADKRRITHRAVMGISMGGGGTASFGFRHHDKFDVLAPLGGPVDWTWMMHYIETNNTGGFAPNDGDTAPTTTLPMPTPTDPYEHPSTFNDWWYEYPRTGNGGSFARDDYSQIFRDLSLMFGNPNGNNTFPGGENLPQGVDPASKAVRGEHPGNECQVWLDPIDGDPDKAKEQELANNCPKERCANNISITGMYDREYNAKAKWPVITVCDGSPQDKKRSPYANHWTATGNNVPLEVGLAVDYNGNGVRDENEPILRQSHEPWTDTGKDGKLSKDEPGYGPGNLDPAGDDYDPQYNPTGAEGNHWYDEGEPYADDGLDGVPNTASSPYDSGEGDKKFTVSKGLQRFWDHDPRSLMTGRSPVPGGAFDAAALRRIDLWTDGGTRDLFNFAVAAQHLTGGFAAEGRNVAYFTDFSSLPGQKRGTGAGNFTPQSMAWDDVPGGVMLRYGPIDPTPKDLDDGAGQHVGSVPELAGRLRAALYFMGQRWPDAPRHLVEESSEEPDPSAPACEVSGNCTFDFTDAAGRKGPVTVSLPPGYAHAKQKGERYPIIYLLHGYGQTPEDLGAAIVFLKNWMNSPLDSSGTRLPKAIVVYVDGRCRKGPSGEAECIRGTFYVDSPRATGGKLESWFLGLMDHMDKNYRTMGETDIDWTE